MLSSTLFELDGSRDEVVWQRRDTVGRVHLLLPPSRVSHGPREEGLHAFDGNAFGLRHPNKGEDARLVRYGASQSRRTTVTHVVATQEQTKKRKAPQRPILDAYMCGNASVQENWVSHWHMAP